MVKVALSTMWGVGRFPNLADFFKAGQAIGFTRFELNHAVDSQMLRGLDLKNGYRITSVHEPCPADVSTGTLKQRNWLISAPDESDRQAGVVAIQHSIDLAHELGAAIVIIHPGRVDVDPAPEARLYQMYRKAGYGSPEYAELKQKLIQARSKQAEENLKSVRRSLLELGEYADRLGIRLGLENRFHYHEIPLPDELDDLLHLDDGHVIGYWHDVGHAQVLENLGFASHAEWLERFSARIIGTHLHDVVGIGDHRAAGTGHMDWDMVARHLPSEALRTCEFQNDHSPDQVASGVNWLLEKRCIVGDIIVIKS